MNDFSDFSTDFSDRAASVKTKLPVRFLGPIGEGDDRGREALETAGVKFLETVPNNSLFQHVELPANWKLVYHPRHLFWTHLIDHQGRKRAGIFSRNGYSDPYVLVSCRLSYKRTSDYDNFVMYVSTAVFKDGLEIYTVAENQRPDSTESERHTLAEDVDARALEWLQGKYPNWQDPRAYWI